MVAPFNPVQDRHVGQRNVSVVQVAPNQIVSVDFFSQNLSLTPADTLIEVQRLEGEALELLALAMGQEVWGTAGGAEIELSHPTLVRPPARRHARQLPAGTFRETLQDVPATSESRRVMGVMQGLAARHMTRGLEAERAAAAIPPGEDARSAADTLEDLQVEAAKGETKGTRVRMPAGRHIHMSLTTSLPRGARRGAADVWRVVEHAAGRITGGVTIIVQAK